MALHWNILLLLFGGLQGLLLVLLFIRKKQIQAGYGFLTLYLLTIIAQIFLKVADKYWLMQNMGACYTLSYQLPLLYGPLVYLFTRQFLKRSQSFAALDCIHFLPFFYSVILSTIPVADPNLDWLYTPLHGIAGLGLQILSLGAYHYRSLQLWDQYREQGVAYQSETYLIRLKWIRKFIIFSCIITVATASLICLLYQLYPGYTYLRSLFILLTLFIYWITYQAMSQPVLFAIFPDRRSRAEMNTQRSPGPSRSLRTPKKKYANSTLTDEESSRIIKQLEALMEKKAFVDPEVSIDKLATLLQVTRHVLSQVINQRLGQSFYDYINGWRLEEAKRLLKDPGKRHYKISSIAYDAGFNSLSTFNDIFKRSTGLTPSQYRDDTLNDLLKQRI